MISSEKDQTVGRLVHIIDDETSNVVALQRNRKLKLGSIVTLWRLPGRWGVWAQAPEFGCWWLLPDDDDAHRIVNATKENPADTWPVIRELHGEAVVVRRADINILAT